MSDTAIVEPPPETPIPLESLDAALAPLRRVLHWASGDLEQRVGQVRSFEALAARQLAKARALDLPAAIAEQLDEMAGQLAGYDADECAQRQVRLAALYQLQSRLDALLGLPVPRKALEPVRARKTSRRRMPRGEKQQPQVEEKKPPRKAEQRADPPPKPWWEGNLDLALADLAGVSETLVAGLSNNGVETAHDLLLLCPTGEEVLRPIHGAGREVVPGRVAVGGRLMCRWTVLKPDGTRTSHGRLRGAGVLDLRWCNGDLDTVERLVLGEKAVLAGTLVLEGEHAVLIDPEIAFEATNNTVRLQQYALDGVSDEAVRGLIGRFLPLLDDLPDPIPAAVLARVAQVPLRQALTHLHTRGTGDKEARSRLAFDEALLAHLGLAWSRHGAGGRERGLSVAAVHSLTTRMARDGDFRLDDYQQRAMEDIKRDLLRKSPMRRVLNGEAGVGQATVALLTAVAVAETKVQVLYLSTHPAAAVQKHVFAAPRLREAGLVGRLVEGEVSTAMRDALGRGEVHVLFGTPELLEQKLVFRRLGLVIVEEQEPFGLAARAVETLPAPRPHTLIVPTTPVGIAVAMAAYPTYDVTVLPSTSRKRVKVLVHAGDARREAYARAAAAVASGQQALVVFPLIDGKDALDRREAMRMVGALESEAFAGHTVQLFHGAMPREEQLRVHDDFRQRRVDVLVATTLIEDAPALANVGVVVVEQADRVDLTRLQRIGGFMASSRHAPEAILVVGDQDAGFRDRFAYVSRATDGFALNDDLAADGLADLVVAGAPPVPSFQFADLSADRDLLWMARAEALSILASETDLRRGWAADLARELRDRWSSLWPDADESWPCPVPERDEQRRRRRRRKRSKR